jgi:hypothetical protein
MIVAPRVKRVKTAVFTRYLSEKEFEILKEVRTNVFSFLKFIWVIHPVRGKVPFDLYPFQTTTLYEFLKNRFTIILKFRQAGLTELIAAYCLWLAMYQSNKNIIILSIKERVAKKLLKRIKFMYRNLPDYLKVPIINGRGEELGTSTDLEFASGSVITSVPTTEDVGRSEAASLLVIDEAAIIRWADQIWAAIFPTISTGGSAIVNSCVTGDTEIIGRNGNFKIEQVCPKEFGVQDIRFMNLEVLTHKLQWKKAIYGLNKGNLETWEIQNEFGDTIKCTPAHKFLTPFGWRSAEEIVNKNLYTIIYNHGISKLEKPPITIPPQYEVLKEISGFPNYLISNLGKVYYKENKKEKEAKPNKLGYRRIKLWSSGKNKTFHISNLVAEHFIGKIPLGYVVDHINCITTDDYVTNLQIITKAENAKRAAKFSRGLNLNTNTGKGAPDLQLVGYIKYLHEHKNYEPDKIISRVERKFHKLISRAYISRIVNNKRNTNVKLSKLFIKRKFSETIYDITVEGDESYISNSNYISHNTPYGAGNWFHRMWVAACSGGNNFVPIRLRWQMHPERDQAWYNEMAAQLGPKRTAQEIDGDFLTSGSSVFHLPDIKAIEDELRDLSYEEPPSMGGKLLTYKRPRPGIRYFLGADISTGRAKDYSAYSILDEEGTEVECFKAKIPPNEFADLIMRRGKRYNNALLAPETNDIGLAVTSRVQAQGYPRLYYSKKLLKAKGKSKYEEQVVPGWLTTSKNRPVIISELEEDLRLDNIYVTNPFFVQEAYTFIYDDRNKPIAMGKNRTSKEASDNLASETFTDDSILALAITNHIRKTKSIGPIILPR